MKHTQSKSSAGKDKNRCRFCGMEFVPAWNHPQQSVCNARECRGKAAAERSRRYSKSKKAKQAGRDVFAAKERRTYLHRNALELLAGNEINPLAFVQPGQKLSLMLFRTVLRSREFFDSKETWTTKIPRLK